MVENLIHTVLPTIISCIELIGILVVTVGSANAFYLYIRNFVKHEVHAIKFELADSLATALEFKMAAEILKTVLIRDINEIVILAAVIVLRALLSFLIHMEMKSAQHTH